MKNRIVIKPESRLIVEKYGDIRHLEMQIRELKKELYVAKFDLERMVRENAPTMMRVDMKRVGEHAAYVAAVDEMENY